MILPFKNTSSFSYRAVKPSSLTSLSSSLLASSSSSSSMSWIWSTRLQSALLANSNHKSGISLHWVLPDPILQPTCVLSVLFPSLTWVWKLGVGAARKGWCWWVTLVLALRSWGKSCNMWQCRRSALGFPHSPVAKTPCPPHAGGPGSFPARGTRGCVSQLRAGAVN